MVTWPTDPPVVIEPFKAIAKGDHSNVSHLHLSTHTASHVDAPVHFGLGDRGADALPFDALLGPALVVDVGEARAVTAEHLRNALTEGHKRVLVRSRNSRFWREDAFRRDFTYLTAEAAQELVQARVRLVGVDYLSVDEFGSAEAPAHRALLAAGVVVVEGLDLSGAEPGRYELICLPLRLAGLDGAPVRAVLRRPAPS